MVSLDYIDENTGESSCGVVDISDSGSTTADFADGRCYLKVHGSSFSTNLGATEKAFQEMVSSPEILHVVLDLTNSIHFNSRALKLLVELQLGLEARGGSLTLTGVTILTERLFEYTRLSSFFHYRLAGSPLGDTVVKRPSN